MKDNILITEISLEDFLKLNLVGYKNRRHFFDKNGKEVSHTEAINVITDDQGNDRWIINPDIYSKFMWDKVDLNKVVLENVEFSEKEGFKNRCICLALHKEPSRKEIEEVMKTYNYVKSYKEKNALVKYTEEEAYNKLLFNYSYLDKWLTMSGYQTYLIRCDVPHLYSEKRKFCTHDDYFEVPKNETKVIYLVRY